MQGGVHEQLAQFFDLAGSRLVVGDLSRCRRVLTDGAKCLLDARTVLLGEAEQVVQVGQLLG